MNDGFKIRYINNPSEAVQLHAGDNIVISIDDKDEAYAVVSITHAVRYYTVYTDSEIDHVASIVTLQRYDGYNNQVGYDHMQGVDFARKSLQSF